MDVVRDLGAEQANRLNRAAIRSLAPLEVGRLRQALSVAKEKLESFEELQDFLAGPMTGHFCRWRVHTQILTGQLKITAVIILELEHPAFLV